MKVAICAIIKDCSKDYLIEWVGYHKSIGVDYFFIYDNESSTPISEVLCTINNVFVFLIKGSIQQLPAYNNCLNLHKNGKIPKCDWIAFIDDDEFINIENNDIKKLLHEQSNSGLGLNWIVFGQSEKEDSNLPRVQKYKRHLPVAHEMNKHIKSIVQPNFVSQFVNPHFCNYTDGKCVDILGREVKQAWVKDPVMSKAWINHYYCKSEKEFNEKVIKGRVDSKEAYTMSMFHSVNAEATCHILKDKKEMSTNNTIVLITPTGGREKQIKLCAKWMKAQTYNGHVTWIVVDDCLPLTTEFITSDFRENWNIIKSYPTPVWQVGDNTQCRNIQAGLSLIPKDKNVTGIFIIEDDDYYSPKYLRITSLMLLGFDLCGETDTIYYNVQADAWIKSRNMQHSSLFQTAFTLKVVPMLEQLLKKHYRFIDIELFKLPVKTNLFSDLNLSIGIKGFPGRPGIGNGHNAERYSERIKRINPPLSSLIGSDADFYKR